MDKKTLGQVFTPNWVVVEILDLIGYQGKNILCRHIMDNSCGDGAFLAVVVRRYCEAWKMYSGKNTLPDWDVLLRQELENYIHGIDIDPECCKACIGNLDAVAAEYGVSGVKWNIVCGDALEISERMYGSMDFIVGNPPYVRIQNIPKGKRTVKHVGLSCEIKDLYITFIQLGVAMLSDIGRMCLITPSHWLRGSGGKTLRRELLRRGWLKAIVSMSSMQVFPEVTTYTAISLIDVSEDSAKDNFGSIELFEQKSFLAGDYYSHGKLPFTSCVVGGKIYVGDRFELGKFRNMMLYNEKKYVRVKNGFATLADGLFIGDNVPSSDFSIKVVKASTGKWSECFFPYDKDGNIIKEDEIKKDAALWDYLLGNKAALEKRDSDSSVFYAFGRTQGVKDVYREKFSVSIIARNVDDLKLTFVPPGAGVYGGLYILPDEKVGIEDVRKALSDDDFPMYLRLLGKYKSGGYYAFSSIELENFLNFKLSSIIG